MPDLKNQIRVYYEQTTVPVDVDTVTVDEGTVLVGPFPDSVRRRRTMKTLEDTTRQAPFWTGPRVALAAFAVILVVGVATFAAVRSTDPESLVLTGDPAPDEVLADYEEARNAGDVDAVMAFYAEDAVVENHPLDDGDGVATGVREIRGFEAQVPIIQGSTGGIEYTDVVVSGNTVTFNTKFINSRGDCFGSVGHEVTVEDGKITRWVAGPEDPSQCE